jgi:nucleotide-binding universal stress UspA family protein
MTRNEIVVGLDDSPSAKIALRWAAEQAIRRQAVLRAIHVLTGPTDPGTLQSTLRVTTRA